MNTFVKSLYTPVAKPIVARTANGMRAFNTTSNSLVDLYSSIGGMRGKNVIPAFEAAFNQNVDLAVRIAQHARDIRGGMGERKLYRDILLWLEANHPYILTESKLLDNTVEIGRFDDLLIFTNPEVKFKAFSIIRSALLAQNGLAAKWMPRKGPVAVELREFLGLTPKNYRKLLVALTDVVEQKMCAKNWNEINFSHVPSVAMSRYMTAFHRNAPERMEAFKAALTKGDKSVKVNASAVYPYNITLMLGKANDYSNGYYGYRSNYSSNPYRTKDLPVAQAMWDAQPDYMNGVNILAVVDNSGSMTAGPSNVAPLDVAASLGVYTAQFSKGAFKDLSISFSDNAQFVYHNGDLADRLYAVTSMKWGGTDLHSVFNLVLGHAKANRVPQEDMPKAIVIFSDMQFNTCRNHDDHALGMIKRKFEDAGYDMPAIIFWNLNDYGNKPGVKFNDQGVALVSGFSPAIMKSVLSTDLENYTPVKVMENAVMVERYNWK